MFFVHLSKILLHSDTNTDSDLCWRTLVAESSPLCEFQNDFLIVTRNVTSNTCKELVYYNVIYCKIMSRYMFQ